MRPHWHNEDGALCEQHAPDEEGDLNNNETDVPENCVVCGRPCEYSLTPAGVAYVTERVRSYAATWPQGAGPMGPEAPAYYRGSRRVDVVRDWAQDLYDNYGLDPAVREELAEFLALTRNPLFQRVEFEGCPD